MKINIEHLYKTYGKKSILKDINLEIGNGLYGLLGPNGAGKTTLIKILATIEGKSKGSIEIDGVNIEDVTAIRKLIGYMPQEFSFYPQYSVYEIMEYFMALSCVEVSKSTIMEILGSVNLADCNRKKVKALSGGMKRRLGIAVAIINSPKLLLVDEPTVGLDPEERMNFRKMLSTLAECRTIILSTHIIPDIEETCDNLAIMKKGTIIYSGSVNGLIRKAQGHVWELSKSHEQIQEFEKKFNDTIKIVARKKSDDKCIIRYISETCKNANSINVLPRLEDAYMELVGINNI